MAFPKTTLRLIADTLIAGFDGYGIDNVGTLAAGKNPDSIAIVSDDLLPYLLFDTGNAQTSPWQAWEDYVAWDIPATLRVKGPPEDVDDIMLETLQALMQRTKELIGLPIDEEGNVVPFTPASASRFDKGELQFVAERGAPFLRSFSTQPSQGGYATANIMFHVESTLDLDPRGELPKALQIRFGIIPMSGSLAADPTLPDPAGIAVVPRENFRGLSAQTTPDPIKNRQPPLRQIVGVADADRVIEVLVTPYSNALSVGTPTQTLSAIAKYANWNTVHVEKLAAWTSSNVTVATVDASGVVTRVAAGTCTVSCLLNGVPSNGVAITCT